MGRSKKILLVDDEKDLVSTVTFRLEANGYEVVVAYDGEEALRLAKSEAPDLIILDLMLPKIDGYKVCATLKNDRKYKHIPVMLFSARAQETDRRSGKAAGADAYMTKPFEPKALLEKVKELTTRSL